MIKKIYMAAVMSALFLQSMQTAAAQTDEKSVLADMNALYEYAWSLDYPQQAAYDNIIKKTEFSADQVVSALPSAALGYQIKDYDGDDRMELLVVRSDTTQETSQSQLIFQMYEANEGDVTFASEITADVPSFVTGIGKIRIYSRNTGDKILIGCDQYEEGFLWDGLTFKTSYYEYNGITFNWDSGMNVMGSFIEDDYMKQQFGAIGMDNNQMAEIGEDKTVYDCLPGTELIAQTRVDSDFNQYISWINTAQEGDTQTVGTAVVESYGWFPGQKPVIAQSMEDASMKPQRMQDQIRQLSDQADYLYIVSDFQTMQIDQVYYLIPDEGVTRYDCYQTDGIYISTIPYGNAKSIIDTAMTSNFSLPAGQCGMIVWNSPYGLCAYSRTYKDYNPWYSVDENGNSVEHYPDVSQLPYMLDESEIRWELECLGLSEDIVIPVSQKTE